jgi:hypothetical protein
MQQRMARTVASSCSPMRAARSASAGYSGRPVAGLGATAARRTLKAASSELATPSSCLALRQPPCRAASTAGRRSNTPLTLCGGGRGGGWALRLGAMEGGRGRGGEINTRCVPVGQPAAGIGRGRRGGRRARRPPQAGGQRLGGLLQQQLAPLLGGPDGQATASRHGSSCHGGAAEGRYLPAHRGPLEDVQGLLLGRERAGRGCGRRLGRCCCGGSGRRRRCMRRAQPAQGCAGADGYPWMGWTESAPGARRLAAAWRRAQVVQPLYGAMRAPLALQHRGVWLSLPRARMMRLAAAAVCSAESEFDVCCLCACKISV